MYELWFDGKIPARNVVPEKTWTEDVEESSIQCSFLEHGRPKEDRGSFVFHIFWMYRMQYVSVFERRENLGKCLTFNLDGSSKSVV